MSLVRDRAYILTTYPLKERDQIVVLFSKNHGKKRGVATGGRGFRSRFGSSLSQLSEVDVTYFEKENRDLVSIRETDLVRSSIPLVRSMACPLLLSYISESIDVFFQENLPSRRGFRLIKHVLDALFMGEGESLIYSYFSLWILIIAGIFPDFSTCGRCGGTSAEYYDPGNMDTLCLRCRKDGSRHISRELKDLLIEFKNHPSGQLAGKAGEGQLKSVNQFVTTVRRHFLNHELKTYRFIEGCDKLFIL